MKTGKERQRNRTGLNLGKEGMTSSSICSWTRWCHSGLWSALICLGLAAPVLSEGAVIRLGPNFRDVVRFPMLENKTVEEVLHRESLGVEAYVRGIDSCQELLAIPTGTEPGYAMDQIHYAIISRIKAECWVLVQLDPKARVAPLQEGDGLDEKVVLEIRAYFATLPGQLSFPAKVLTEANGATVGCNGEDLCGLRAPETSEWADYAMAFQLFLTDGDRKFIGISDSYEGRGNYVRGVIWSNREGRVVEWFPGRE